MEQVQSAVNGLPPAELMSVLAAPSPPTISPPDATILNNIALANRMMTLQQAVAQPNVSLF